MSRTILLDSGPPGLNTNPRAWPLAAACGLWVVNAVDRDAAILVPEIADHELRRELIRARRTAGVARLDAFIAQVGFLPIATAAMRRAVAFWAGNRRKGPGTGHSARTVGPGSRRQRSRHRPSSRLFTWPGVVSKRSVSMNFVPPSAPMCQRGFRELLPPLYGPTSPDALPFSPDQLGMCFPNCSATMYTLSRNRIIFFVLLH